jgi:hypothetical protein
MFVSKQHVTDTEFHHPLLSAGNRSKRNGKLLPMLYFRFRVLCPVTRTNGEKRRQEAKLSLYFIKHHTMKTYGGVEA